MNQSEHVFKELLKCERLLERLYNEQFEVEMPHSIKSRVFEIGTKVKELKSLVGFIYKSEGVMQ